jgi:hypothetical protein
LRSAEYVAGRTPDDWIAAGAAWKASQLAAKLTNKHPNIDQRAVVTQTVRSFTATLGRLLSFP